MCNYPNKIICKTKSQAGFSLIEIMAAFAIVTLVFIGLMQAFPYGLSINKSSENSTITSFLAQGEIERLRSLGYDNITIGTVTKHQISTDPDDYRYFYYLETNVAYIDQNLAVSATDTGLKRITATIYFSNSITKKENSYNLTTLISQL